MTVKKLTINHDNSERRIDNYLLSLYKNVPKSKIYNIIRKGEVRVNSKRIKPSYKLKIDDLVRIPPYLDEPLTHNKKISSYLIEKHTTKINAYKYGLNFFIKSIFKSIFYIFFKKSKAITHFAKAYGTLFSILNLQPTYRPKIKT